MFGWMGTILRVNLSTGKITKEKLDEKMARDYIGARDWPPEFSMMNCPRGQSLRSGQTS